MPYICQNPAHTSYSSRDTSDNVSELGVGMKKSEEHKKREAKLLKVRQRESERQKGGVKIQAAFHIILNFPL